MQDELSWIFSLDKDYRSGLVSNIKKNSCHFYCFDDLHNKGCKTWSSGYLSIVKEENLQLYIILRRKGLIMKKLSIFIAIAVIGFCPVGFG
jgi:hypothetical protein